MNLESITFEFLEAVRDDPLIGPSHITLFVAIVCEFRHRSFNGPIRLFSKDLMRQAKISSRGTYYKCLQELENIGYIRYVPSHNPMMGSMVHLPRFKHQGGDHQD